MIGRRLLAVAAWLTAGLGSAAAVCPGSVVLFQDQFASLQPSWGEPSAAIKVDNGELVLSPVAGTYTWAINNAGLYDDIDMCVSVTTVAGIDPSQALAGPIFWYQDVNNFYVFELSPNGKASVWRRQRGRWLAQVEWRDAAGANKGDGGINELRVTTAGGDATFYVNGTEFRKIAGSPPEDGQLVGLFAGSPEDGAAVFQFDGLRVTKP